MMWLLTTTLCISTGVATAKCETEARIIPDIVECVKMKKATRDYIEVKADDLGAKVVFLGVDCTQWRDG